MTGVEAPVAAEADTGQARCKGEKEFEIKEKYKAELAALPSFPPLPESRLPTPNSLLPAFSESQVRLTNINTSIHVSSSNLESSQDQPNRLSQNRVTTNSPVQTSPAPRHSGCTKKLTQKVEYQKRREAKQAAQLSPQVKSWLT